MVIQFIKDTKHTEIIKLEKIMYRRHVSVLFTILIPYTGQPGYYKSKIHYRQLYMNSDATDYYFTYKNKSYYLSNFKII